MYLPSFLHMKPMCVVICAHPSDLYKCVSVAVSVRYLNGRYGSEDIVRKWGEKYSEVCNAMDMVGFQEQVRPL